MEDKIMENLVQIKRSSKIGNLFSGEIFPKAKKTRSDSYLIVHPLFDEPEEKIDIDAAGPLVLTKSVKWSLVTLRAYLIVMIGLAFYRSMVIAGLF